MLPPHLQPRLDRELDKGEVVRWVAQPCYSILKKMARNNWMGLGVLVGLFVLFLLVMAWVVSMAPEHERQDDPWTFLVAAGVLTFAWICSLPLFLKWSKSLANNTIYAVTEKRAIIMVVHKDKSITERDYRGDELIHLARKESFNGSGTLTFESARGAGASAQTTSRHRFQAIEDVIGVERMLREQFGES